MNNAIVTKWLDRYQAHPIEVLSPQTDKAGIGSRLVVQLSRLTGGEVDSQPHRVGRNPQTPSITLIEIDKEISVTKLPQPSGTMSQQCGGYLGSKTMEQEYIHACQGAKEGLVFHGQRARYEVGQTQATPV